MDGQVEEVWIKTEQIEGESSVFVNIKREDAIDINDTDADPFTETTFYTVTEISPNTDPLPSHKIKKRRVADKGPFKCVVDECGKEFPRKSSLDRHMFMHSGAKPFACDICGMRFAQKAHIKPHQRKHTGETPYSCGHCDLTFMYQKSLKRHLRATHKVGEPLKEEVNRTPEGIRIHFECDECGEKFKRKESYKWHKQRHAGEIPFECDECGKPFFRKYDLTRHMRMHTGEKPYECDICGMRFSQNGHIKPHKLTHSEERPFGCEECGKKFTCPSGLRQHKKSHLEIFLCSLCNTKFDREDSLVKHMKDNHLSAGSGKGN